MYNRKFFFLLGGFVVVLLLVISFYLALKDSEKQPPGPNDKILIRTSGLPVETNNFLNQPKEKLGYGAILAENQWYKIIFFSEDQGFLITLKQKPLSEAQALAEAEFLKQLAVDQEQACLLKAYIGVPRDVDENVAVKNYPLSFCSGGEKF